MLLFIKKESRLLLPVFILLLNFSIVSAQTSGTGLRSIVIDAGHGGTDNATRGAISREKDVTLKIALKLGKAIQAKFPNIKVSYTRVTDVHVPLYKRIELANNLKADLFISLHCNSVPPKTARRTTVKGTETFVSGYNRLKEQDVAIRENASILLEKDYQKNYDGYDPKDPESIIILSLIKNVHRTNSIKFATLIQREFRLAGRTDRGVKEQSLAVLARASMPAVLTEVGFISNPTEEKYINSYSGQQEIVTSMVKAVENFKKFLD